MNTKKSRSPNWGETEKALLKELIKEEIGIIECKATDTNTNTKKKKAWEKIHKQFCELGERGRSLIELKQQWRSIKLHAKKSLSEHKQAILKTGGGPKPTSPPEDATEILELIPLEFQEDFNEFDSNGPHMSEFINESPSSKTKEDDVPEVCPSTSTPIGREKKRKMSHADDDGYKKTITQLAEQRSEELLKQQEAEHKKRMENMELEMNMKVQEHNERMRILKDEADMKKKINVLQFEVLNLQKINLLHCQEN